MIDIENLTEQELSELKQKLEDKLKHPICRCCGTRCGNVTVKTIIKEIMVPKVSYPTWGKLGCPSNTGICNCTGACRGIYPNQNIYQGPTS